MVLRTNYFPLFRLFIGFFRCLYRPPSANKLVGILHCSPHEKEEAHKGWQVESRKAPYQIVVWGKSNRYNRSHD